MFLTVVFASAAVVILQTNQNKNNMKSILLAGALLLAALTSKTFAADGKITPLVQQAFKTSFENAFDAQWSVVNRVYRVEFMHGGGKAIAFFKGDGTLVATSRYITLENLPDELMHKLVRHTVTGGPILVI